MKQITVLKEKDVSVIINSKIGELRDKVETNIRQIESWINDIITQTIQESKIRKERCEICNSKEDAKEFEGHHIAGRKHDYRQITTCKQCHRWLSDNQKTWDVRWLLENQSESLKNAFFYLGLYDVLILKSKKNVNSLYETFASSFTETISELLKRD